MPETPSNYDYEEGKRRISTRLADIRSRDWSPTPEARRLQSLVEELESIANKLGGQEWLYLEVAHDAEPPKEFDLDGSLIDPGISNAGRFAGLRLRLQELAQTARDQLAELPSARERNEVPHAAQLFLHLRYQCGLSLPTLYDSGEGVSEFSQICAEAKVFLSAVRIRNILSEALKTFDRHLFPGAIDYFLIPKK